MVAQAFPLIFQVILPEVTIARFELPSSPFHCFGSQTPKIDAKFL